MIKTKGTIKYFRWYGANYTPEEIDLDTALEVLRRNYPTLSDDEIKEQLPGKMLHSPVALYWSEVHK